MRSGGGPLRLVQYVTIGGPGPHVSRGTHPRRSKVSRRAWIPCAPYWGDRGPVVGARESFTLAGSSKRMKPWANRHPSRSLTHHSSSTCITGVPLHHPSYTRRKNTLTR